MVNKIFALAVLAIFTACVGATTIVSSPLGAEVYVRDTLAGTTPFVYQDIRVSFTKRKLVVKKDGHQSQTIVLRRNGKFAPINLLGAPLVYPLLYLADYPDTTYINMNTSVLQTADLVDEQTLLQQDATWLQQALVDLKAQFVGGSITKKYYKVERKKLKALLHKAKKND